MDDLNPDLLDIELHIRRASDGGVDVLREFVADLEYNGESGSSAIGQVEGWIGWSIFEDDLADAGDAISFDAGQLSAAAADIIETFHEKYIEAAVLINRMYLAPTWRGKRLSRAIIAELEALLRLDPGSTVVVLQPEPQKPEGGPVEDGPNRDKAMARLRAAYQASGLEPWRDSPVWWWPL